MNSEELGYTSSAPMLVGVDTAKTQDVADISTLEQVFKLLEERRAYYVSVDSLTLQDDTFTIEEQLAINKKVLFHIQELEALIGSTVAKVRSTING